MLGGRSPKAILAIVLLVCFLLSLPLWLSSTSEDKQHFTHSSATIDMVQQNIGMLDLQPEEKQDLQEMLRPEQESAPLDYEQLVWVKDIVTMISPWISDETEAETIARWVHIYSVRFDLQPELVLSVMAVESRFDHFAVSNVGAIGLMQVMPFWKDELGSKEDNLLKIETNIRYGCAILRHYLNRYHRLDMALSAYNGSLGQSKYPNQVYSFMKRFQASKALI